MIGYAYNCDGPDCETHTAPVATAPPYLPYGFIETRQTLPPSEDRHQFCSWECLMKFAADQPIPQPNVRKVLIGWWIDGVGWAPTRPVLNHALAKHKAQEPHTDGRRCPMCDDETAW